MAKANISLNELHFLKYLAQRLLSFMIPPTYSDAFSPNTKMYFTPKGYLKLHVDGRSNMWHH